MANDGHHETLAALERGEEYVPIIDLKSLLQVAGFELDWEDGSFKFYRHKGSGAPVHFDERDPGIPPVIGPRIAEKIGWHWPPVGEE